MPDPLPGKGFLGWLGRQVGYVKRAVKADGLWRYERGAVAGPLLGFAGRC